MTTRPNQILYKNPIITPQCKGETDELDISHFNTECDNKTASELGESPAFPKGANITSKIYRLCQAQHLKAAIEVGVIKRERVKCLSDEKCSSFTKGALIVAVVAAIIAIIAFSYFPLATKIGLGISAFGIFSCLFAKLLNNCKKSQLKVDKNIVKALETFENNLSKINFPSLDKLEDGLKASNLIKEFLNELKQQDNTLNIDEANNAIYKCVLTIITLKNLSSKEEKIIEDLIIAATGNIKEDSTTEIKAIGKLIQSKIDRINIQKGTHIEKSESFWGTNAERNKNIAIGLGIITIAIIVALFIAHDAGSLNSTIPLLTLGGSSFTALLLTSFRFMLRKTHVVEKKDNTTTTQKNPVKSEKPQTTRQAVQTPLFLNFTNATSAPNPEATIIGTVISIEYQAREAISKMPSPPTGYLPAEHDADKDKTNQTAYNANFSMFISRTSTSDETTGEINFSTVPERVATFIIPPNGEDAPIHFFIPMKNKILTMKDIKKWYKANRLTLKQAEIDKNPQIKTPCEKMFAYVGKILIDPFNDESLRRLLPKLRYDETKQQQMIDALAKATTDMNSQRGGGEEKYPDWIISGLASLIAKIQQ